MKKQADNPITTRINKRCSKVSFVMLAVSAFAVPASAEIGPGDIIGTASTIYNGLIGSVTVTPAYTLHSYTRHYDQRYGMFGHTIDERISRNPLTGDFVYYYSTSNGFGPDSQHNDPFVVGAPRRLNYYCDLSTAANYFTWMDTVDFRIAVWTDSIQKTGFWPPSPPFETWLKTSATALPSSCNYTPPDGREVRQQVQLPESGTVIVAMPLVNYSYAWPMLCWVGGPYDY